MKTLFASIIIAPALIASASAVAHAGSFAAWGHEFTTDDVAPQQFEASRRGPSTFNATSEDGHRVRARAVPYEQVFGPR